MHHPKLWGIKNSLEKSIMAMMVSKKQRKVIRARWRDWCRTTQYRRAGCGIIQWNWWQGKRCWKYQTTRHIKGEFQIKIVGDMENNNSVIVG